MDYREYWVELFNIPEKINDTAYVVKLQNWRLYRLKLLEEFDYGGNRCGINGEMFFIYDGEVYNTYPKTKRTNLKKKLCWLRLDEKPTVIDVYKSLFMCHIDFAKIWVLCSGYYRGTDYKVYYRSRGEYYDDNYVNKWRKINENQPLKRLWFPFEDEE